MNATVVAIAKRNLSCFQASSRISSFDQKPASGKMPESESAPITKVMKVIGMCLRRPPISGISKVFVAWLTEPAPWKSSDLKKACVNRWNIAAG